MQINRLDTSHNQPKFNTQLGLNLTKLQQKLIKNHLKIYDSGNNADGTNAPSQTVLEDKNFQFKQINPKLNLPIGDGYILGTVTSSKLQTETHLISITPNPNLNLGEGTALDL